MRFNFTILNVTVIIWIIWIFVDSIIHYKQISSGEGWGVLMVLILCFFGVIGLFIDVVIQVLTRKLSNKTLITNIIGLIVVIIGVILINWDKLNY